MNDILELITVYDLDVYFRKYDIQLLKDTQPEELEYIVYILTNEVFEDYEYCDYNKQKKRGRRLKNPDNFEALYKYVKPSGEEHICICSEDTCTSLYIIQYKPTDIYFAVGSVCYGKFHDKCKNEVYYKFDVEKCKCCNIPLIYKNKIFKRNTSTIYKSICFECANMELKEELKKLKKDENKELKKMIKDEKVKHDILLDIEVKKLKDKEHLQITKYNDLAKSYNEQKKMYNDLQKNYGKQTIELKELLKERERIYFSIPYHDKERAKKLGAVWDSINKKWYSTKNNTNFEELTDIYEIK